MPLLLGDQPQLPLTAVAAAMTAGLVGCGVVSELNPLYYLGVSAATAHVLWQIWTANINDSSNLWTRFHSNQYTGAIITAAIITGHLDISQLI